MLNFAIALSGLLVAVGCGKPANQAPAAPPAAQVGVVTVRAQSVPLTHDLVGRLAATRQADVRARVAGVLQKRLYREGSNVKEGQALFQIDPMRFRPILMTSFAFILGVFPMVVSSGAGANSRHAIGTGVVGGMLSAAVLGVLLIPVCYVAIRRMLGDQLDAPGRAETTSTPATHP